jgi:hypothetical protein
VDPALELSNDCELLEVGIRDALFLPNSPRKPCPIFFLRVSGSNVVGLGDDMTYLWGRQDGGALLRDMIAPMAN